jgi:nucleotide-binding universal stress UspA family protein
VLSDVSVCFEKGKAAMKKIMVCYNRSEASKKAVRLARDLAGTLDGEVIIVTSLEKGEPENQDQINEAKEGLAYARSIVEAGEIPCSTDLLIRGMEVERDLVEFARDREIDIMLIGVVRKSKVGKLFFGSTAQYLILKAPCPVLSVK